MQLFADRLPKMWMNNDTRCFFHLPQFDLTSVFQIRSDSAASTDLFNYGGPIKTFACTGRNPKTSHELMSELDIPLQKVFLDSNQEWSYRQAQRRYCTVLLYHIYSTIY